MKLREIADPKRVHLDVAARDVMDGLRAAAGALADDDREASRIMEALLERERLGSTSVGGGFAIPHCKLEGIDALEVAMLRFAEPIDFGAPDESRVSFFFVVLSPPDQPAAHLQILSQIARVLKREDLRRELLTVSTPQGAIDALLRAADAEGL